jgi:hypothetical protein
MRLPQNTEYAVVGALIVYTVFLPSIPMIRQLLSSSVGVAAGIALVYWVAKTVSVPLALVVLVAVVRSSAAVIREHLDCSECPSGYTFDSNSKACKKQGATDVPPSCAAPAGMSTSTPSASMGATGASK